MDNQGVQGAVQQLQQTEQQNVAIDNKQRKNLLDQFENSTPPNQAAISQALATLKPDSNIAPVKVGGALNTKNYSNLCLAYVDDATGNTNRQPTAIADYLVNQHSGKIKTDGTPPKGSRIYFAPTPDNPAGHIMLSNGDGTGTGATTNQGIKTFKISDWEKYANQQYIGYASSGSK